MPITPPPMMTIDWGRSLRASISRLVTITSPASGTPGMGGTKASEPVQSKRFFASYASPLHAMVSVPSSFRPVMRASPLTTFTPCAFIEAPIPATSFRTTLFLRATILP